MHLRHLRTFATFNIVIKYIYIYISPYLHRSVFTEGKRRSLSHSKLINLFTEKKDLIYKHLQTLGEMQLVVLNCIFFLTFMSHEWNEKLYDIKTQKELK